MSIDRWGRIRLGAGTREAFEGLGDISGFKVRLHTIMMQPNTYFLEEFLGRFGAKDFERGSSIWFKCLFTCFMYSRESSFLIKREDIELS